MALFELLAAALLVESASAMPVDFVGRDENGTLQFRGIELSAGEVPSVTTTPRGFGGTLSPIVLAPAPPPPLAVGPIFARARPVSTGSGTPSLSIGTELIQSSRQLPSLVSHDVEVSEPPDRSSGMGAGGVAVPLGQGVTSTPSQPTVVVVTVDGTIDSGPPGSSPVSNPLPGAVWMFATGLGLIPFLVKRRQR